MASFHKRKQTAAIGIQVFLTDIIHVGCWLILSNRNKEYFMKGDTSK